MASQVCVDAGCNFWTADERLFNAVNPPLSWVRWSGRFKPIS